VKQRLYFAIILCVGLGVVFTFAGPYFSTWMANNAPHPMQQQRLQWFYQQTIFVPMAIPAQPVPALAGRIVPSSLYAVFNGLISVLLYVQIALLLRRIAICFRARAIQAPLSLNRGWKIVLWVSFVLWLVGILVGILVTLLPRLVNPFLGAELSKAIGFASGVIGAFIVPFFWLIPSNLFGPSFFVIELMSFRKEGLFPLPNTSLQGTPASGRP
jgi:hypothetical protein